MADLTTLSNVREYLDVEVSDTEDDALFSSLITRFSELTESHLNRTILSDSNPVTELLNGDGTCYAQAKLYPVSNVVTVKVSADQDFGSADDLTASVTVDPDSGILFYRDGLFSHGFRNVQIVHDHIIDVADVPAGLEQKIIEMVAKSYGEKENLGIVSLSLKDGSMTKKLLVGAIFEAMKKELSPYANLAGGI